MSAGKIIVIGAATAKPGQESAVRAALEAVTPPSRAEAGNVIYQPHENTQMPGDFLVYEIWQDEAAFKAHEQSEHFKTLIETIQPLSVNVSVRMMRPFTE